MQRGSAVGRKRGGSRRKQTIPKQPPFLKKPTLSVAAVVEDGDLDDLDLEEMQCGLGPCAPRWMQIFASKQAFLATFCITWVLQGMYYTYFVSVITTIEKLFQIQSKTTGFIMSATEIGQIGSSLLLTYYGGQGHRPKWIAWGECTRHAAAPRRGEGVASASRNLAQTRLELQCSRSGAGGARSATLCGTTHQPLPPLGHMPDGLSREPRTAANSSKSSSPAAPWPRPPPSAPTAATLSSRVQISQA